MSMTEKRIRDFAEVHGLGVYKRITTGSERAHFATFELFAETREDTPKALKAWEELRTIEDHNRLRGESPFTRYHAHCNETGLPFIELDSVWCELPR